MSSSDTQKKRPEDVAGDAAAAAVGIDIGTTSIKVALLRTTTSDSTEFVHSLSLPHHAYPSDRTAASLTAEQSVPRLLAAIDRAVQQLRLAVGAAEWARVKHIGVSNQMHGEVRWRSFHADQSALLWEHAITTATATDHDDNDVRHSQSNPSNDTGRAFSPLVTWEDRRCDAAFLAELNALKRSDSCASLAAACSVPLAGSRLSSGFGIASLSWIAGHSAAAEHSSPSNQAVAAEDAHARPIAAASPEHASASTSAAASATAAASSAPPPSFSHEPYRHAGSIGDLLTSLLTGHAAARMDASNAASWGAFDLRTLAWDAERISAAGVPLSLLPAIVPSASPLGALLPAFAERWCLPAGCDAVNVHAAVGDHAASMYAIDPTPALGSQASEAVAAADAVAPSSSESASSSVLVISMGTSSQACRVLDSPALAACFAPAAEHSAEHSTTCSIDRRLLSPASSGAVWTALELRPYVFPLRDSGLLLAASLSGGNVLAEFVRCESERIGGTAEQTVWQTLLSEAAELIDSGQAAKSLIEVELWRGFGERGEEQSAAAASAVALPWERARASGSGDGDGDGSGAIASAVLFLSLCVSLMQNLHRMARQTADAAASATATAATSGSAAACAIPAAGDLSLRSPLLSGLRSLRLVGSAFTRCAPLRWAAAQVFGLPIRSDADETNAAVGATAEPDAAHGAALLALHWKRNKNWWRTYQA